MQLDPFLFALISAAASAGGAYVAVRVELRFLWRDQEMLREEIRRAHRRIDSLKLVP